MLLKYMKTLLLLLGSCFLAQAQAPTFKTGIVQLSSLQSQGIYTINQDNNRNEIILAISSFSSIYNLTSCYWVSPQGPQINFTCTQNVQSVGYLFYQKTPLIYSSTFTYYFFEANQNTSAIWKPPINLTLISKPTVAAMLSGFMISDVSYASIYLQAINNASAINISRTLNVRSVNFSFILIQNYGPYNLIFSQIPLDSIPRLAFQSLLTGILSFWGISNIAFQKTDQFSNVALQLNYTNNNQTGDFSQMAQFSYTQNILLSGIFLMYTPNISYSTCPNFYSPQLDICQPSCINSTVMKWNTSQLKFSFCLPMDSNNQFFVKNYPNLNYTDDNLMDIVMFEGKGCQIAIINETVNTICLVCQADYFYYNQRCVCRYGLLQSEGSCRQCQDEECTINLDIESTVTIVDITHVNIRVTANLLNIVLIQHSSASSYLQNLTVNRKVMQVNISYSMSAQQLSFDLFNVSTSNQYLIQFSNSSTYDESELFYLRTRPGNLTNLSSVAFLWEYSLSTIVDMPLSQTTILNQTSSILKTSQSALPIIFVVGFFIGNNINAFSLFQTVSLIYLINFIKLPTEYDKLTSLLKEMFLFQSKPFLNFLGNTNLQAFRVTEDIQYDPLIYQYTQGKLLVYLGLNSFVFLLLQILGIFLLLFLVKKCLKQSSNKITNDNGNDQDQLILKQSKTLKQDKRQQLTPADQPEPPKRPKRTIRSTFYSFFCSMYLKKYVYITPIILTQHLSFFFLAAYELTLPLFNFYAIISRLFCLVVITMIIGYPLMLVRYEPQLLLKCSCILVKSSSYKRGQVWLYFFLTYHETILYGILLNLLHNSVIEVSSIIFFHVLKLIWFRNRLKNIQIIRLITILFFFISILLFLIMPVCYASILTSVSIVAILLVLLSQLLKFIRGIIKAVLFLFRDLQQIEEPQNSKKKQVKKPSNSMFDHFKQKFKNSRQHKSKQKPIQANSIKRQQQVEVSKNDASQQQLKGNKQFKSSVSSKQKSYISQRR